jgi:hypothetical protein
MKKSILFGVLLATVTVGPVLGQLTFNVSPGLNLNSANLGYKVGKVVPFIGFQYLSIGFNLTETGTEWNSGINGPETFTEEVKFDGALMIPTLGVKYFIKEKNKMKAYVVASVAKPMVSGKMEFDSEPEEEFSEQLQKVSLWGGEAGFGMEYFFDENFSIGGEFGVRCLTGKYSDEYTGDYYNPNTGLYVDADFTEEVNITMNPTYTRIALNFYF